MNNMWSFDTSEGKKMLEYNGSKLVITPETAIKGRIKIFAMLRYKRASIKIPLFRFMYFNDVNNVQDIKIFTRTSPNRNFGNHRILSKIKSFISNGIVFNSRASIGETEEVVGRCTYIVDDNLWSFDTSEGKKMLEYNV